MIYLDHNATAPPLPQVVDAMLPFLREEWGNPSSTYRFGAKLKKTLEVSREQVADLIGSHPMDIIFTSGGTESDNAALNAIAHANPYKRHIITSNVEHSAILSYCHNLERQGWRITYLPVDHNGLLSIADLEDAITHETAGVSLMWANNETGVLFPIEKIAAVCKSRNVLFHCDAVQATGKVPIDLTKVPIDYLSLTGHKLGSVKGIGALYIRRKAPFISFINGGHQERGRRGGTVSVPLVVGLGVAAEYARRKLPSYDCTVRPLRDALENGLISPISGLTVNGHLVERLPNTTNLLFPLSQSEALLLLLDQSDVCASSGSACLADSQDPSHVISAMKPGSAAQRSVRFSISPETTQNEINNASRVIKKCAGLLGECTYN